MSLSERSPPVRSRGAILTRRRLQGALLALALATTACTVRPLYSNAPITPGGATTSEALASVAVKPVITRYGQQVRNQLIFLLYGGAGQPTAPAYDLTINVVETRDTTTTAQTTDVNEPASASMTVISDYVLVDRTTQQPIAKGKRQVYASFDVPRQEYAGYRAQRDAEDRAARELAELLKLAIAQDLVRHGGM